MRPPMRQELQFIANLKTARRTRKMTQAVLAGRMKQAGFPRWGAATVCEAEAGTRALRLREALALAHLVGFSFDRMTADPAPRFKAYIRDAIRIEANR